MSARSRFALVFCTVLVIAFPAPLFGQDPPPEFELPDVISPGRRPQPAAASPASVSVLTAAELRRLGVRTVGEAIAYLPETVVRAYGGPGSLLSPSIRGSSTAQVLVLLDGVPLNSVLVGSVDLSTIPIDDVERIEVLRGPFSVIYGSGALGGVISIVTRRRARPAITVGGGSLGAFGLSLTAGTGSRVSVRYDAAQGDRPNSDMRAGFLSFRTGDASPGRSWDLSLFASAGARGAPGSTQFPSLTARMDDQRIAAALTVERGEAERSDRFRLSLHRDGLAFREPAFGMDDRHTGTTWTAEWHRTVRRSARHAVSIGVDAHLQSLTSTAVGEHAAGIGAAYLQDDRIVGDHLVLSTGLRADWHSAYGAQVNPRAGLVYFLRPDLRLRLAAGRTFRGPTLADLYWPFDGFAAGNPALGPEHAWSVDAGIDATVAGRLALRASVFWSDVRDQIIWIPDASFIWSPQNVGAASIRGASVELDGPLASVWRLRASATWMAASDAATGLDLPDRPRLTGALVLTTSLPREGTLSVSAVVVGQRFADAANTVVLPAYATAGLTAELPLAQGIVLRASVRNLFDARYESVWGYPAPGRTVHAEVMVRR
jgi:outer membrane cobalamin receptor